ncbi:ABC transporter permease [Ekhidna sp.]|uniref:ABC transporter permease n=1 Tax=Ekhidna sp. TaxID=2608089 RepID=UPI0032ECE499
MLRNFFVTSYRSLARNKAHFFLGVTGLTLGISCVIALYSIINFHSNYDKHQENYDTVYRIIGSYKIGDEEGKTPTVPHPLSNGIKDEIPGIEAMSNTFLLSAQINIEESGKPLTKINQNNIAFVQPAIFEILTFKWAAGGRTNFNPNSAFLSATTAQKFFGNNAPLQSFIGKTIVLANKHNLTVEGIYEDLPKKTDFPFEIMTAYENQEGVNPYFNEGKAWGTLNGGTQCVMKMAAQSDAAQIQKEVNTAFKKYYKEEGYTLELQPLANVHSESVYNYSGVMFESKYKLISYTIAIFLALIGSINFINLTTARAIKRAREVGIRKVMGGLRSELILQFILETFVIVSIALCLGFVLGEQILILFNQMLGMDVRLIDVTIFDWVVFSFIVLFGMTLLSGLYPALVLSKFSALNAIKIKISNIDKQSRIPVRKILVGLQFGFSISLIIGAMVIFSQTEYMRSYDMGFRTEGIINLRFPSPDPERQTRLKNQLESNPTFDKVSLHIGSPLAMGNNTNKYFNPLVGKEETFTVNSKSIDENYLELFEIGLISGRNINSNDPRTNVLITENSLSKFNLGSPHEALGKIIESDWGQKCTIVGVVEDFNSRSLQSEMMPVLLFFNPQGFYEIAMRLSNSNQSELPEIIKSIEATWNNVYPELLIEYGLLEDQIASHYEFESTMAKFISFFVCIALIISILGLYGLTDYMANSKRKEIGIRKVIGANISQILILFGKEVVLLLLLAFVISSAASYWLMNSWLEGFEYRINIGWEIMMGALFVTALISFLTMSSRSFAAAKINPVEVLKDE